MLVKKEIRLLPQILFFILDFTYLEICKLKNYQKVIKIQGTTYSLFTAITKPTSVHFSALTKDPRNPKNTQQIEEGWYYYDDCISDGDLKREIRTIEELLREQKGYILLYCKQE